MMIKRFEGSAGPVRLEEVRAEKKNVAGCLFALTCVVPGRLDRRTDSSPDTANLRNFTRVCTARDNANNAGAIWFNNAVNT